MSLKARVRRLQTDVEWMRWWGRLRRAEHMMKLLEVQQAREAAEAAKAAKATAASLAPKERLADQIPRPAREDSPGESQAPRQDKIVVPTAATDPSLGSRRPERLSGDGGTFPPTDVAVEAVADPQPDPPPEMQIRPVTWRFRTAQDDADDAGETAGGTYGRCLTDYDVLGSSYYDDDDG